jgi:RimJ/RimL family protein N-acetyltransferase
VPSLDRLITTPRLVLKPQTLAVARALLAGEDPGVPLGAGYPHADTVDALSIGMSAATADSDLGGWFITRREDGRLIGDCGTKGWVDEAGRVEIGYGLAAPYREKGYGSEAVHALVDWLLAQPDVLAVTAEVEVGNIASRRLLEKVGFDFEEEREGSWWFVFARPAA